ncbi:hypothetical protein LOTGIDRAFT_184651 [Lottia gigantea]|uniref:RWD domain-containing protein n=1 Tax=Lottia gigantea TaxID=225164 RepID=V3ZPS8_LOTGI|nr:hypothetical protein LOTGIDRAFT_184651 [Lottia gigantea]ESO82861.1 hypothetical protein LOTGIDRAFT_184651 [Lottia gigantea]
MAALWSSEQFVEEYKDLQASAMGVDCVGQWVLLAGRKALALVNLNNTQKVVKVARKSKWEISCVQWNPHASHASNFVTASNQRLDILTWNGSKADHICNLKAHSRTVSDVDWSPFDVNIVASCSVDTFSYLWDIREPKKPIASFQTVAGAYQVKWNKVVNNQFATTHEGDLRIWDPRKGNMPLTYIAAHLSKIHGLDWSPFSQDHLVTASQDCSVRFWNWKNSQRSEGMISLKDVPVWRARYTPFGTGLVTGVVPQLRRGENSLYLWNIENHTQPVHAFLGHKDVVLDFQWRKQPVGEVDHQLVTWSRDQTLRMWRIDPALQKLCGHEITEQETSFSSPLPNRSDITSSINGTSLEETMSKSSSTSSINSQQIQSLINEFSLINSIPNVNIELKDPLKRKCTVRAFSGKRTVVLNLTFPDRYPFGEAPEFQFGSTTLDPGMEKKLLQVLKETSLKHVQNNMICLEPCLRNLIQSLDSLTYEERRTPDSDVPFDFTQPSVKPKIYKPSRYGPTYGLTDSSVPFPRTSGASFCSAGFLVVYGRPADLRKSNASEMTPKTLSDMVEYNHHNRMKTPQTEPYVPMFSCSPPPTAPLEYTISNFYTYKEKKQRIRTRSRHKDIGDSSRKDTGKKIKNKPKVGVVRLYDISSLMPIHKQLAEKYILDPSNISEMCKINASAADSVGRKDLVQIWMLAAVLHPSACECDENDMFTPPWAMTGRPQLETILQHYSNLQDIQTLAMLCCLFWVKEKPVKPHRSVSKTSMEYVPANKQELTALHTLWSIIENLLNLGHWSFISLSVSFCLSNSWSDSYDDFRIIEDEIDENIDRERLQYEIDSRMLDPTKAGIYDQYKLAYAKILYQWGLINQSALIMKYISFPAPPERNYEFVVSCHQCNQTTDSPQCAYNHIALKCSICRTGVKGAANFCLTCGHGGHSQHILDWFEEEDLCPTGCGCSCLINNPVIDGW